MTTPESSLPETSPTGDGDRRLHPLSWLFVLLQQLKQFIVPLVVLLFIGRRGDDDGAQLWPLIGVAVLLAASLWQYFTFRYRITGDSVIVNSGLFHRSLRQVPFSRIHNVALHQSLLHRMFGVAEVRLESAGGTKPEAQMRVLALEDARALERLVRRRAGDAAAPASKTSDADDGDTLLALTPAEVLRLGLVSNRGLLLLGGAAAALSQATPRLWSNVVEGWFDAFTGYAGSHQFGIAGYALAGASLLLACIVVLRLLSVVVAMLQYYGFRLQEHDRRLTVERGLLTRLRTSASRRRLQAFTLREGVVHRLLKRRSLDVDTAVSESGHDSRALRELAPIATPEACDALVRHVLPQADWPPQAWHGLHPGAWWRLAMPGSLLAIAATIGLCWRFGPWGLLALAWLPWAVFVARHHARRAGYACDEHLVAFRAGWWSRHWRFAEIDRLQALQLRQSPLDRRLGTASLWLDTAGAGALSESFRLRHLTEHDARSLFARLARHVARQPLRW